MKSLYILIQDGGDGSFYPQYTFNSEWIKKMEELADNDEINYPDLGCDGDGFHYDTLKVPDDCTLESLGIFSDCAESDNA